MSTKYLISGANGFLGLNLLRALDVENNVIYVIVRNKKKYDFYYPKKAKIKYLDGQSKWEEKIKNTRIKYFIHTAAYNNTNPDIDEIKNIIDSNVMLGIKMLEAAKNNKYRTPIFIHCLSYWQFSSPKTGYSPNSIYAASKQAFLDFVEYYRQSGHVKASGLVLYDIYGKCDKRIKFLNIIKDRLKIILKGGHVDDINLTRGEQEIEFLHVDDVIKGIFTALKLLDDNKLSNSYYCLKGTETYTLKEQVEQLIKNMNIKDSGLIWGGREYNNTDVLEIIKNPKLPNWRPEAIFVDEIKKMVVNDE